MAAQIRARKISPVELLRAHLDRIDRWNARLNAIVAVDRDRAQAAAREAEAAVMSGKSLGPLHGVPVTIKSSIDVAGLPTEAGTKLRQGYFAPSDAPLVGRLRAAGAIVLGNTNVPEFLMAWETDNLLYGRTNIPWDLARTPGGSSGGEAAAIAAGLSAAGVGSDGGGSIRVPAHFSGICGLKPTPGRIPATGHFPACTGHFALLGVVGPMARTVGDLDLMLQVLAGPDDGDPAAAPVPYAPARLEELRKLRIGFFEDDGRMPVTPETAAAVRRAGEALRQDGFVVEPFRPEGLEEARQLWWTMFGLAGSVLLGPIIAPHIAEASPMLQEFHRMVAQEPPLTAEALLGALVERDRIRSNFLAQMEKFPVLLCPVCAIPAFRQRERSWTIDGQTVKYPGVFSYSQWFNLLGNPAAVVPAGRSPEGLPIGVQVVGRPWREEQVLGVAARIENACGGFLRPPLDT